MSELIVKIHDLETGEIIERELNANELKEYNARIKKRELAEAEAEAKATAKAAILDRIGLTADELQTILG